MEWSCMTRFTPGADCKSRIIRNDHVDESDGDDRDTTLGGQLLRSRRLRSKEPPRFRGAYRPRLRRGHRSRRRPAYRNFAGFPGGSRHREVEPLSLSMVSTCGLEGI